MKTIAIKCQGAATLSIDLLTPLQGGLKTLSEANYRRLRAEIERDGFIEPVSVWEDGATIFILNGHQRVATLQKMKLDGFSIPQIPINWVEAADLNEAKRKVLALASQYGEVSEDGFREFASAIDFAGDDFKDFFSFPELDLSKIVLGDLTSVTAHDRNPTQAPGEDEVPPVTEPIAKLGDIFELGRHRLMCGDSTNRAQLERLINGDKVDLLLTDPPYGVSIVGKNGQIGGGNLTSAGQYAPIIGDDSTDIARKAYDVAASLKIANMVIWGGNYFTDFLPPRAGWIVWNKRGEMAPNSFADCEMAWTTSTGAARIYDQVWRGMIKEGESGKRVHPTQKPVNLSEYCVNKFEGVSVVLDQFGGSGSTLIACEKMGVTCLMMEMAPAYVDVIIARWEKFTGQKATKVTKLARKPQ